MTNELNGVGVTDMTITVRVLTVDGTRRMSHRFFEQIPRGSFIDQMGERYPSAQVWGYVNVGDDDGGITFVGTLDGRLVRMQHDDARTSVPNIVRSPHRESPYPRGVEEADAPLEWQRYWAGARTAEQIATEAWDELLDDLPQLYLGG